MNNETITAGQAAATALASGTAGVASWSLPFDFIAVPAAVLFMALAGTAAGMVVQPPAAGMSRGRMFILAAVLTLFAATGAVVLREFGILEKAAPAMAFIIGLFAQTLLPAARERLKAEVHGRNPPKSGGSP